MSQRKGVSERAGLVFSMCTVMARESVGESCAHNGLSDEMNEVGKEVADGVRRGEEQGGQGQEFTGRPWHYQPCLG